MIVRILLTTLVFASVPYAWEPSAARGEYTSDTPDEEIALQFRFTADRSLEDLDPHRLEPSVRELPFVRAHRFYDDRHADANFVTLVVALSAPSPEELAALRDTLVGIPRTRVFAVDRTGRCRGLETLAPSELLTFAATDASARP